MKKDERKQAVALKYDPVKDTAPLVVGTGQGYVAEQIIRVAEENKVPVVEDRALAGALSALGLGDAIPQALYEVVAQILVFVGSVDKDYHEWKKAAQAKGIKLK